MTYFCVEHLHRLPEEVGVPLSAVLRAMLAYQIVSERQAKALNL